jgi:hypothetical protein
MQMIKIYWFTCSLAISLLGVALLFGNGQVTVSDGVKLIATPRTSQSPLGNEVIIDLVVINLGKTTKTLFLPNSPVSGFDCLGAYYSSRNGGFWRAAELQLFKDTTHPTVIDLPPGKFREFEIRVNLFKNRQTEREVCLFTIGLHGEESVRSNEIAIWNEGKKIQNE